MQVMGYNVMHAGVASKALSRLPQAITSGVDGHHNDDDTV
jgi:hypothetical protein